MTMSHTRREKCGCQIDVQSGLLTQACLEHAEDAERLHEAAPRRARPRPTKRYPMRAVVRVDPSKGGEHTRVWLSCGHAMYRIEPLPKRMICKACPLVATSGAAPRKSEGDR